MEACCQGWLAQRESVRLVTRRSGFNSRRRTDKFFFLAVADTICETPIYSKSFFCKNTDNAIYWTKKQSSTLPVWKRVLLPETNGLTRYTTVNHSYEKNGICNLQQYQLTSLTYGGAQALIGNRPRRQEGPSGDRKEDNRTGSRTWDTPWNRGCLE